MLSQEWDAACINCKKTDSSRRKKERIWQFWGTPGEVAIESGWNFNFMLALESALGTAGGPSKDTWVGHGSMACGLCLFPHLFCSDTGPLLCFPTAMSSWLWSSMCLHPDILTLEPANHRLILSKFNLSSFKL